jgi:hypothetical protein
MEPKLTIMVLLDYFDVIAARSNVMNSAYEYLDRHAQDTEHVMEYKLLFDLIINCLTQFCDGLGNGSYEKELFQSKLFNLHKRR